MAWRRTVDMSEKPFRGDIIRAAEGVREMLGRGHAASVWLMRSDGLKARLAVAHGSAKMPPPWVRIFLRKPMGVIKVSPNPSVSPDAAPDLESVHAEINTYVAVALGEP